MATERVGASSYLALKKQSDGTTVSTPDVYVPYYSQSLSTDPHLMKDTPMVGSKFRTWQILRGMRSHGGSLNVLAEPNTIARFADMFATKGSTTGSDPYTHPFTLSLTTNPNYYTVDISFGSYVVRWWGVKASKFAPGFNEDKMVLDLDVAALGSFYGREIASVSTNTLTLKTDYDAAPTVGLVASDLVRIVKADGSYVDTTVSSITSTTVTVASAGSGVANGDMLVLRPATPSYTVVTPFLWPRTEYRFAADASTALSASQTRLERETELVLEHMFNKATGEDRSGSFDPASLIHTVGDVSFKVRTFLDADDGKVKEWNALTKKALVMRSFSETGYELRITLNNMKAMTNETPTEQEGVIYHEVEYGVQTDSSDGQAVDIKVINAISTI